MFSEKDSPQGILDPELPLTVIPDFGKSIYLFIDKASCILSYLVPGTGLASNNMVFKHRRPKPYPPGAYALV